MARLHVGIIGIGYIGGAHIEAIKRLGYAKLSAIVTRNSDQGRALCEELDIPRHYADYREILADPEIEVVHNCTPNNLHYEINQAAILAGKHVLSEKPLTTNSIQAAELVSLLNQANVQHAVNFVYRHYSVVQHIKGMIENGELGEIYSIHGAFLQDWLLQETDYNWRVESKLGGPSRAIADIGSHWCDLAQYLAGDKIATVNADLATFVPVRTKRLQQDRTEYERIQVDTEDYGSVLLHFQNGARGSFTVSQACAGRKVGLSIEINGSKASVRWEQENAHSLWIGHRTKPNELLLAHPQLLNEHAVGGRGSSFHFNRQERWPDAQRSMLDSFYRKILYGDKQKHADFTDGLQSMHIVDAILKSNHMGAWVII